MCACVIRVVGQAKYLHSYRHDSRARQLRYTAELFFTINTIHLLQWLISIQAFVSEHMTHIYHTHTHRQIYSHLWYIYSRSADQ